MSKYGTKARSTKPLQPAPTSSCSIASRAASSPPSHGSSASAGRGRERSSCSRRTGALRKVTCARVSLRVSEVPVRCSSEDTRSLYVGRNCCPETEHHAPCRDFSLKIFQREVQELNAQMSK